MSPSRGHGCIDFDGVLHSYTSGWMGETLIPDAPTEGAQDFVARVIRLGFTPIVASTRAKTPIAREAMAIWLGREGFPEVQIAEGKPPASFYLDDRGLRFEGPGKWPTDEEILAACVPWNKR